MPTLRSTRLPELMSEELADLHAVLDATVLGHIGLVDDGDPVVLPTAVVRWDERLLVHGSTGSRWMRLVAQGAPVCVSVAAVTGVQVARSTFESALLYRSAMIFGSFSPVPEEEKAEALDLLVERILPGRTAEVRRPTAKELAATSVLQMPLETWSVRVLDQMPEDPPEDVAGPAWAGLIRLGDTAVSIEPAPDLTEGISVPSSVSTYRP